MSERLDSKEFQRKIKHQQVIVKHNDVRNITLMQVKKNKNDVKLKR